MEQISPNGNARNAFDADQQQGAGHAPNHKAVIKRA
jgi:hypothetical protein